MEYKQPLNCSDQSQRGKKMAKAKPRLIVPLQNLSRDVLRKADVLVAMFKNLPRFILYSHSMQSHLDTGCIIPWPRQWPTVATCPKTGVLLACLPL